MDNALKAYQFYLATDFLGKHPYMTSQETKNFAVLLMQHVFGANLNECKTYWNKYNEGDEAWQMHRFCNDIAKHITGMEDPLAKSLFLCARSFPLLFIMTQMVLASSFDDKTTVHKLEDNYRKIVEKAASDWENNLLPIIRETYKDENP